MNHCYTAKVNGIHRSMYLLLALVIIFAIGGVAHAQQSVNSSGGGSNSINANLSGVNQGVSSVTSENGASLTKSIGFRIDSDVYADESEPPIAQFKTLFTETQAIDLDTKGSAVVVLDFSTGTLILLDKARRVQTMLEMANVDAMLKDALAQTPSNQSPVAQRDANQLLVVKDSTVEYQVKTEAPEISLLATRYNQFADATTKLVAIFPPYKPPQLRLELNRVLTEAKELPMVTTRVTTNKGTKSVVVARLLIKPELDSEDKKDLQIVAGYKDQFKFVSSSDYFGVK